MITVSRFTYHLISWRWGGGGFYVLLVGVTAIQFSAIRVQYTSISSDSFLDTSYEDLTMNMYLFIGDTVRYNKLLNLIILHSHNSYVNNTEFFGINFA